MPRRIVRESRDVPVIVSACLLGVSCRYDGGHKRDTRVLSYVKETNVIPVCPEILAGLTIPRGPSRLQGGDGDDVLSGRAFVLNDNGKDITSIFMRGSEKALRVVRKAGAHTAILKERSPSCGVHEVYDQKGRRPGTGVFTALLKREGFSIFSEEDLNGRNP